MDKMVIEIARDWELLSSFNGLSFCFTGKHSMTRAELEDIVNVLGGDIHSSVRQSTMYLVVPNGEYRKGSKHRSAVGNGHTVILRESDFCGMLIHQGIWGSLDQG